jgi:hypothetical protein
MTIQEENSYQYEDFHNGQDLDTAEFFVEQKAVLPTISVKKVQET